MNRLMADLDGQIGEDVLDISKAQAETIVQPHRVANDLAWKTLAFEGVDRWCRHQKRLN